MKPVPSASSEYGRSAIQESVKGPHIPVGKRPQVRDGAVVAAAEAIHRLERQWEACFRAHGEYFKLPLPFASNNPRTGFI
jgi:hypothetical protein